jgi:CRISPR-associated endonuclease Cas1
MPSDHQLDESITLTCAVCSKPFHPRRGVSRLPRTCSASCIQRLRLRSRFGTPLDAPQGKGAERECPQCHQGFIAKHARQIYCSNLCHLSVALSKVRNSNNPEARERLRHIQLQKIAEGTHAFIASGKVGKPSKPSTRARPLSKPRIPTSRADLSLTVPSEDTPITGTSGNLPPLPNIPESQDGERAEDIIASSLSASWTSLTFPLLGHAAQDEWRHMGELREDQADKALRYEEVQTSEGRTVILAGQGSYLGVENGALLAHQGRTHGVPAPAKEFFYPALHTVRRILWVGAHGHLTGTMTLAAAAWCQREGVHLTVLDGSGFPLLEVLPATHQDAALRRRQWLISSGIVLPGSPHAGAIVRTLVRRKVEGQYQALIKHSELPGQVACLNVFQDWQQWLSLDQPTAPQQNVDYLRMLEARLALAYFRAWEGWALTWSKPDVRRIPPHWLTARTRISPLAPHNNGRHAIDPLNACLNYCYAALASQCRQSLYQEGFDLAGGFLHADKPGRDSLVYDVMELERGAVDDLLLSFLGRTALHYGDFARKQDGSLLLHPQLTRLLLAECRVPQSRVDGHAKWLRLLLLPGNGDIHNEGSSREDSLARDSDSTESM